MSNKRGRKCSIKSCDNFQHTHKYLSFFRFPKDVERCRIWIGKTQRFDLLDKANIHDERICQQHFDATMFLNESQNRLHQYAIPSLYLTTKPPPIQSSALDNLLANGLSGIEHVLSNTKFDMGLLDAAAALLHQNNLTITPVFSKPKSNPLPSKNHPISQPLNLSISNHNGSSPNSSIDSNNASIPTASLDLSTQLSTQPPAQPIEIPINDTKITTVPNAGGFRRPRQVFTMEQENQLADYVRETSNYYSGLSSKEVRILAFVYGVCNQVEMPSGWHESHQASFDWCVGFIKRTKLPPTMITGISLKGKDGKQSKVSSGSALNKPIPQLNGNSVKTINSNQNIDTPIEID